MNTLLQVEDAVGAVLSTLPRVEPSQPTPVPTPLTGSSGGRPSTDGTLPTPAAAQGTAESLEVEMQETSGLSQADDDGWRPGTPDYSAYVAEYVEVAPGWGGMAPAREEEDDDGLWQPGDDGMLRFDDDDFAEWDDTYTYHTSAGAFLRTLMMDTPLDGIHAFPLTDAEITSRRNARSRAFSDARRITTLALLPFIDVCYDRIMEQIVVRFPRGGLTRRMRNRLMHALNGNTRNRKPIPCSQCGAMFQPAVAGHKRCSVCISAVFDAAGINLAQAPPAAAAAPTGAAAAVQAPPAPSAAAPSAAATASGIQYGPTMAGSQQAARVNQRPVIKCLWATIMEEVNELRQVAPNGFVESSPDGITRNDSSDEHLSIGGSTLLGVGYVVTFEHAAISEDYLDYSYHRQRNLKSVVINGHVHSSQDWLYTQSRVGLVAGRKMIATKTKTVQASENGRLINVDVFRLSVTDLELSAEKRYAEFTVRDAIGRHVRYSSYRGANETGIVCGNDDVVCVPTNLFMECERYFVTTETSKVAEATIRGSMKNNNALGGAEMEALIKYHSARHQRRIVARNAAIGGRASTWSRAKDALNSSYEERPWWMPGIAWAFCDPYADTMSAIQSFFMTVALLVLLAIGIGYVRDILAIGSAGLVYLYNAGSRTWAPRKPATYDKFDPVRHWMCGVLKDYLWWHAIGDVESGWRVEDAKCPPWELVGKRWVESWDTADVLIIIFSPIFEEWLRRRDWHDGFLTRWVGVPGGTHPVGVWLDRIGLRCLHEWFTGLRARRTDFGIVITAAIIVTEALGSGNVGFYLCTTGLLHYACLASPWYIAWLIHWLWNCMTVGNTKRIYGLMRSGSCLLSPLALLCAGGMARGYRYIAPMGVDSEFTEMMADDAAMKSFPMKTSGKIDHTKTTYQRGTSRLVCLLRPFVACASFAANQANTLHSVAGRVLKDTPIVVRSLSGMESIIGKISTKMGGVEPVSEDRWLGKFPPMKRARYTKALLTLSIFGFAFFDSGLLGTKHDWDMRSCFLKHEVNLMQPDKFIQGKCRVWKIACSDPRTIQASADEIQAALGPFFVAAGERAATVLDGSAESKILGWRLCAAFGRTKAEVADIIRTIEESGDNGIVDCGDDGYIIWDRKVYAIDASRWDAHVGPELLGLKRAHLLRLGMHPRLVDMVDELVNRRGKFKGARVKFRVKGDVASGDADTLYWNTICGIAVILDSVQGCKNFAEFAERSKQVGIEYEMAAEGSRACYDARLDFCSCVFTPSDKGFTLAPKLGRSLMKLSHSHNTAMKPDLLLASKIEGLSHDLAVFPEVVLALRSILPGLPKAEALSESYHAVGHANPGTFEQRCGFIADRYGIDYKELVDDISEWVQQDAATGDGNSYWRLARLVEVDYGKRPMPATSGPEPQVRRRISYTRGILAIAMAVSMFNGGGGELMKWKVGGLVYNNRNQTSSDYNTTMAGKGKKNNTVICVCPGNGTKQHKKNNNTKAKKQKGIVTSRGGKIKGKGSYLATGLAAAHTLGQQIPKGTFESIGSYLGGAAGRGLANFTGVGDYVFNDIVHTPSMPTRNAGNKQRISNCEYIADLTASGGPNFALLKFALNPGDPASFPWLSKVAALYQKYKFEQLIFEFRSNTSDYAASGPLGSVILSPLYNVIADVPQTKQQLEAYAHAVSTKPSNSIMCGVECDPKDDNIKWYYLRNPSDSPTQFTDPGVFFVATSGLPQVVGSTSSLGELWVHYTVKFDEPILTTRQSVQSYSRIRMANNAAGLADTYFAGLRCTGAGQITGTDTQDTNIPSSVATFQPIVLSSGKPTVPYFVALDGGNPAGTAANTLMWFSSPGVYLIEYKVNFFTGYSAVTTRQQLYNASVSAGSGNIIIGESLRPITTGSVVSWAGSFVLNSTSNDTCISFIKNPLQVTTGGGSTILDGTDASFLRITRI